MKTEKQNNKSKKKLLFSKVAYLAHEPGNNTVKGGSFVSESLFSSTQGTEIFYQRKSTLSRH